MVQQQDGIAGCYSKEGRAAGWTDKLLELQGKQTHFCSVILLPRHVPIWPVWHVTILLRGRTFANLKVSDHYIVLYTLDSMVHFPFDLPYYFDCQYKGWQKVANKSYWWMIKSPIFKNVHEIPHFDCTNFFEIDSYTLYVDQKIAELLPISPYSSR